MIIAHPQSISRIASEDKTVACWCLIVCLGGNVMIHSARPRQIQIVGNIRCVIRTVPETMSGQLRLLYRLQEAWCVIIEFCIWLWMQVEEIDRPCMDGSHMQVGRKLRTGCSESPHPLAWREGRLCPHQLQKPPSAHSAGPKPTNTQFTQLTQHQQLTKD